MLLLGGPEMLSHNVPRSNMSLLSQKSQEGGTGLAFTLGRAGIWEADRACVLKQTLKRVRLRDTAYTT